MGIAVIPGRRHCPRGPVEVPHFSSAPPPAALFECPPHHVVKLFNDKLSDLRRSLYHRAEADGKKVLKGARWLPLKNPENWTSPRMASAEIRA